MIAATTYAWAAWTMLLAGMALSFLTSGLETGSYAVNKIRLELRAEAGSRAARRLRALLRDPGRFLTVVLVSNNLANYLVSAGMVLLLTLHGVHRPNLWATVLATTIVFVFCEVFPKNFFYRHADTMTYPLAGFLAFCRWAFTIVGLVPLVQGLNGLVVKLAGARLGASDTPLSSAGRISTILSEGRASGAMTHAQSVIAERVVNIGRIGIHEIMVPLEKAVLLDEGGTVEEVRELLSRHNHARLGVCAGARESIVGILNVFDALLDETGLPPAAHMTAPLRLVETIGITGALVEMRRRREMMAVVTSATGQVIGLVTIKDLVEEIVGELREW